METAGGTDTPGTPPPRVRRLEALAASTLDVLVVGGGITGAGVALDLALRGLRVAVVERGDWAGATSSASSRLVHGGLRYLEQFELGLVRESCLERGLLLENAAGLVWPERFTYPLHRGGPVGRLRLAVGLLLYTAVSVPRALGVSRLVSAGTVERRLPGVRAEGLRGGGSYLDAATDDSRLTLAVIGTAIRAGAIALPRMEARSVDTSRSGAEVRLADGLTGEEHTVRSRAVVLAGGPFTDALREQAGLAADWIQPTRGSHVVVPRDRLPTDGAVITNSCVDGRVLFLLAWPRVTVIGTTDLDAALSDEVRATRAEVRYLLESANGLVPAASLREEDVVSTWAGLRPLLASTGGPSERSREERVEREGPVYTIAGGKLTAFRGMAETLGRRIAADLETGSHARRSPTRTHKLVGALPSAVSRPAWSGLSSGSSQAPPLETAHRRRYAANASAVARFLDEIEGGREELDAETLLGEVDWAVRHEDCLTAVDFLFRRTDLGLGPRPAVEAAASRVLERLARLSGWDADRCELEDGRVARALGRAHAWRTEGETTRDPAPA